MKPLRILLGNNTLSLLAGSETHTYTLALQLKAMGHYVACFAPELGIISQRLQAAGISCFNDISTSGVEPFTFVLHEPIDHNYDVIISNHNHIVEYLRSKFPKTPIISTVHGVIHFLEDGSKAPEHPALESGVAQFISVSEEIQKLLQQKYNIDSIVIRNFFDVNKFSSLRPANDTPKRFLINTNYAGKDDPSIDVIRQAARHFGAKLAAIGENFTQTADISRAIEDSDVVFGMGRSVLEGVAAGRLGIVHGRWGTGGPINAGTINNIRFCNFSGRNRLDGKCATTEEIIAMVKENYNPTVLEWGKKYIASDHNAVFATEQYINIARELTGESFSKPKTNSGVAADARPFRLAKDV